jgi:hypothetical protein
LNKTFNSNFLCENLPLAFRKKKELKNLKLDFAYIPLPVEGLANLQYALNKTSSLESLSILLYKNGFNTENIKYFFDGLSGMENLVNLELNIAGYDYYLNLLIVRNNLCDRALESLMEWLSGSSDLRSLSLDLYGNQFSLKQMKKFFMIIGTFELTEFNLSYFDFVNQ